MTDNSKISLEVAEVEFEKFVSDMGLDISLSNMDVEDITAFNKQKTRIIRAICSGSLFFNDDGEAVFTPQHRRSKYKEAITFHERTGASLMAMDGKKRNHDVAKTYAVMSDMCGVHSTVFTNLCGEDVKICEAIFAFLMD